MTPNPPTGLVDPVVYRCGAYELDTTNRSFKRDNALHAIEPKAFAVLIQLVSRPRELVTREQLLDEVWGHRHVTCSTLNRVIGLARRALADDADAPNFIHTVHGAGYRYVGPVERVTAIAELSTRSAPPPAVRMPAPLARLIGRETELRQIEEMMEGGRSLTILGTGGMGKTQCALAFAHSHKDAYPDGVWFFDLARFQRVEDWLQVLGSLIGMMPATDGVLVDKIADKLADKRALLFLDGCDQLSSELGSPLYELLRGTQHLKLLATSQRKLSFVSERILRIPPLALPTLREPFDEAQLLQVAAAPAVELLLERVNDAQPQFRLNTENAGVITAICERLDGMPLALELAALRLTLLSPEQVLDRLGQRFRFLVSDDAGRDERHRSLDVLLECSYALLSPNERRLLAWLSQFVQGWTVDTVIDLAPAFGASAELAVDLLTGLANNSLTTVDHGVNPPRYRLLESVREFALAKLKGTSDERRAREAYLTCIYAQHSRDPSAPRRFVTELALRNASNSSRAALA